MNQPPGNQPPESSAFELGINLAGLDFGTYPPYPAVGKPCCAPTPAMEDYYRTKNVKLFRLPFRWEEIQPIPHSELNGTFLAILDDLVSHAAANGQKILLDVHNYGSRKFPDKSLHFIGDGTLKDSDFTDLWSRLAAHFAGNPGIYGYDLMNEPCCGETVALWQAAAQGAVNAIRAVDPDTPIIVEGVGYAAAHQWMKNGNDGLDIKDPSHKLIYSAHQYANANNDGAYIRPYDQDGAAPDTLVTRIGVWESWLESKNYRGLVGEVGVPYFDNRWLLVEDNALGYLRSKSVPAIHWAGGGFGSQYFLTAEPIPTYRGVPLPDGAKHDSPLWAVLSKYTGAPQPTAYYFACPPQGPSRTASDTCNVDYYGILAKPVTVTFGDGGAGGTFTPKSVTLEPPSPGVYNASATFTYTPKAAGAITLSATNNGGLTDPAPQAFNAVTTEGTTAYEQMTAPVLAAWSTRQIISTYDPNGPIWDIKRGDGTEETCHLAHGALDQACVASFCGQAPCAVTKWYDQSGNGNDLIDTKHESIKDPQTALHAENGLACLNFPVDGASGLTAAKGSIILNKAHGITLVGIWHPQQTNASFVFTWPNRGYFPQRNEFKWDTKTGISPVIDNSDTSRAHLYIGSSFGGASLNGETTSVDGKQSATAPTLEGGSSPEKLPFDNFDMGFFRFYLHAYFTGKICEAAIVGSSASAGDIGRLHDFAKAGWATP